MPESLKVEHEVEHEVDPEQHAAEVGVMPHQDALVQWQNWKRKPGPESMAKVLNSVRPIINKSVSKFPKYNSAILGGEAKRLAIGAIKTFDPDRGASLPTHIYGHLKSLGRFASDVGPAVRKSRLERDRTSEYLGAVRDLTEINNREPSDDELRDRLLVDRKTLSKMRLAASGEVAESQLDYLPSQEEEDPRVGMWTNYVYHDLDSTGKLIMDYKLGRNGRPMLGTEAAAAKLGMNPDYLNRRAGEISKRILDGVNASQASRVNPKLDRELGLGETALGEE